MERKEFLYDALATKKPLLAEYPDGTVCRVSNGFVKHLRGGEEISSVWWYSPHELTDHLLFLEARNEIEFTLDKV